MPNEPTRRRPAWMNDDSQPTTRRKAAEPDPKAQRGWQADPTAAPTNREGRSKRIKIGIALAGVGAIIGLLVWLVFMPKGLRPASLVLLGAPAEENLAVEANVAGWRTLHETAQWVRSDEGNAAWQLPTLAREPTELTALDEFTIDLLKQKEKVLVVYLAMHGGAERGEPYLLINAGNDGRKNRLKIKSLLAQLAQLPADQHKLVILDAAQNSADWRQGFLNNDFARELDKLDAEIAKVPNLVVISASSTDERSWVAEEWGQSVFGYYFLEGLRGAADVDGKHRVTAGDVWQYLQKQVGAWVKANRNRTQTPVIYPKADGAQRATAMELAGVTGQTTAPPTTRSALPGELQAALAKADRLSRAIPSPAVYTPHLWREYRATLLRYEQVVRLGDPRGRASGLLGRLTDLERDMKITAGSLGSTTTALPMPAALGLAPTWSRPDVENHFNALLNARDDAERQKLWTKLEEWASKQGGNLDRARADLYGLLLERIVENPDSVSPEKLDAFFRRVGGTPRPAEAHLLYMFNYLNRGVLPPGGDPAALTPLLKNALALRRLTEEVALGAYSDQPNRAPAHPYSEQLYPWIRVKVEAADRERRRGEDLLFGPVSHYAKAAAFLKAGNDHYHAAAKDAAPVRAALDLRDAALADLPHYAQWLASRPIPTSVADQEKEEGELKHVEQLLESVQNLSQQLNQPPATPELLAERIKKLAELTDAGALPAAFLQVQNQYEAHCKNLNDDVTQDNWHMHEAALSIPLLRISPERRLALVEQQRRVADELNRKASLSPTAVPEMAARDAAVRQGRAALAVLGRANLATFDQARAVIGNAGGEWWSPVASAGEQIGLAWEEMPHKIADQAARARADADQPAGKTPGDLGLAILSQADVLARQLNRADVRRIAALDPPAALRRLRLHNLLLEQARRTYRDHWFSDKNEPHYITAMRKLVDDAEALMLVGAPAADASQRAKNPRLRKVMELRALLKPEPLLVASPEQVHWTSERQRDFDYVLTGPAEVLPGFPVLWREIEGKGADGPPLVLVEGDSKRRDVIEPLGADQPPANALYRIAAANRLLAADEEKPPLTPTREAVAVNLRGVFRGQVIKQPIAVDLHRVPHVAGITYPRLPVGGIALQSDPSTAGYGKGNGVIMLVLDISISMKSKLGKSTRLEEAKKALEQVLRTLPDGPVLSLWVFGAAPPGGGANAGWHGMKQVWQPRPWQAKFADDLMDQLNKTPTDEVNNVGSPIAFTMAQAAVTDLAAIKQNFPDSFKGFKTLVVLNDGEDNRYDFFQRQGKLPDGTPRALPGTLAAFFQGEIQNYLKADAAEPGLQVNMVFFLEDKKEVANAKNQFALIQKFPVPGNFYDFDAQSKTDSLVTKLLLAIQQQWRVRLEHAKGKPVGEGSPLDRFPSWFTNLQPDLYTVRLQTLAQDVQVRPGDFIQVGLTRQNNKLGFVRTLIGKSPGARDRVQTTDWLLAAHENQELTTGGLELMTTLESMEVQPTERGTILQYRPSFVWFDLAAKEAPPPLALRWHNLERYPAPAWQVSAGAWKSGAPTMAATWLGDRAAPPVARELPRDPAKSLAENFTDVKAAVEAAEVVVESVQMEKRWVAKTPTDPKTEQPCLVVRLRYPKGKPFLARLGRIDAPYEEHRLYTDADKYTGIFWPVTEAQAKDFTLQLISLEAVKRAAAESGTAARLEKLGPARFADAITVPKAP